VNLEIKCGSEVDSAFETNLPFSGYFVSTFSKFLEQKKSAMVYTEWHISRQQNNTEKVS